MVPGQRAREACRIRDPLEARTLDGERSRTGRRGRRLPRLAVAVVVREERGREDVAGARLVHLAHAERPHIVALAVDEQQCAVTAGGEGADGHVLEPLLDLVAEAAGVLIAHEQRLQTGQDEGRVLPGRWRDLSQPCAAAATDASSNARASVPSTSPSTGASSTSGAERQSSGTSCGCRGVATSREASRRRPPGSATCVNVVVDPLGTETTSIRGGIASSGKSSP